MISTLKGQVLSVGLDHTVIEVGGVGLRVAAVPGTLAGLRPATSATLFTTLVVREDSLTLFGFGSADERDLFEIVQTVAGVGPRLALAMLAVHTPDGLRRAVADEDLTSLCKVPGIGRKGAQRIVLELAGKLGPAGEAPHTAASEPSSDATSAQVVEALVGLGWNAKQAGSAVERVRAEHPENDVATLLRASLRTLGRG